MESEVNKPAFRLTVEQVQLHKLSLPAVSLKYYRVWRDMADSAISSPELVSQGLVCPLWWYRRVCWAHFTHWDCPGLVPGSRWPMQTAQTEGLWFRRSPYMGIWWSCTSTQQSCIGSHALWDHCYLQPFQSILSKFTHREFSTHPLPWAMKQMGHEVAPDACGC